MCDIIISPKIRNASRVATESSKFAPALLRYCATARSASCLASSAAARMYASYCTCAYSATRRA